MRLPTTCAAPGRTPRRSFTLVEMLVVIGIIGILMALSAAAIFKAIASQQTSNAKVTITKVDTSRIEAWKKVVDSAYANSGHITSQYNSNAASDILTLAGGDSKRARVIYISYYLKQQFPISFAEVLDPSVTSPYGTTGQPNALYNPLGPDPELVKKLTTLNVAANNPPLPGESSALLLIAMERGINGTGKAADLFGANNIKPVSFPTTRGGSVDLDILKDDWGTPLQFYRWSTANADLDAAIPVTQGKLRNPLDPENTLLNANWYNGAQTKALRTLFENSCYSVTKINAPYAYYITPVIVSAGPNTKLGLDLQTMAVINANDANDNIYSYQTKRE